MSDNLTEVNAALVEIIRGVVEAQRPGTDAETRRVAWQRASVVVRLADARAEETEFLHRLTERLAATPPGHNMTAGAPSLRLIDTDKIRAAFSDDQIGTHGPDCCYYHPRCAALALAREVDALRAAAAPQETEQ